MLYIIREFFKIILTLSVENNTLAPQFRLYEHLLASFGKVKSCGLLPGGGIFRAHSLHFQVYQPPEKEVKFT
jgi:hypothetical protein